MKYCSQCSALLTRIIPEGDNRLRDVCPECSTIFYQNPKIVAGTLPVYKTNEGNQVLLCKRAIEPRKGYWTLPAGFMENGESTEQAALRETREEANADVLLEQPISMLSIPHIDQVHLFYLAIMNQPEFSSGEESLDVQLFSEDNIPWDNIAFSTVAKTLRYYFKHQRDEHQLKQCLSGTIELSESLRKLEEQEKLKLSSES
ncbi:NUDIX hydrolase [Bacterioplanoides sp. SCSIO 12839]|uniref:NUDIX hydrolase n=1 Tax=Bacterioplanoides sp. SCSIO 12839 TaxID=2829569 RepID=UPI002102D956|nr:NUDIX hydrolase [Bacterioplanoides sp. SCSIO 12839]UTW49864.1 NUDIX hydrolase [Bacterioplanoides sp. SCSIO 12839]